MQQLRGKLQMPSSRATSRDKRRTEYDRVELVGALVHVRKQNAARLEHCQELRLAGSREGGEEGVGALGDTKLQSRCVVCDGVHVLHDNCTRSVNLLDWITTARAHAATRHSRANAAHRVQPKVCGTCQYGSLRKRAALDAPGRQVQT